MQCPDTQPLRNDMYEELALYPDVDQVLKDYEQNYMSISLGKCPNDCRLDVMEKLWRISGKHICSMYKFVLDQRQGVG